MPILLTGGSPSVKSTYAERLALTFPPPHYYIATMRVMDQEGQAKVSRHQALRQGKGFITLEQAQDLDRLVLDQPGTVLLECMCNLTANEMFDREGRIRDVYDKILGDLESLESRCHQLIVVTNEVGSDGIHYGAGTRAYMELLGSLNRTLAARYDTVLELVAGIPLVLKGDMP
ncbi:MAG: bifunctional adenosylcobinamide kinase/adenosylcobinamide-phosphate guanylyltransferase [Clostridiaceae bacterium]|nr:bifunctional adenosylcobinamide kinase/adenosylcobinamide-phosphate guanylyltransferase [Clostridiaceae bacterium]